MWQCGAFGGVRTFGRRALLIFEFIRISIAIETQRQQTEGQEPRNLAGAHTRRRRLNAHLLLKFGPLLPIARVMLLDQRRLDFAYEQIVQDAAKARGACTVLVFVAPNCDAMCACRILSYMLRADTVSYKIKPVAGYGDIAAANEELVKV